MNSLPWVFEIQISFSCMWFSKNLEWDDVLTLLFKGKAQILRFHVINFGLKRFLHLCSLVPSCSTLMSKFPFLSYSRELLASLKFRLWLCSFLTENDFLEVSCFSQSDCFLGSFYPEVSLILSLPVLSMDISIFIVFSSLWSLCLSSGTTTIMG